MVRGGQDSNSPLGRRSGPYDGSTNAGDWIGYIPFNELPHLFNPPSGLIVTANQRTVGTDYKYTQFSRDTAPPWRARRIFDLLDQKTKITMDDVAMSNTMYSIFLSQTSRRKFSNHGCSPETLGLLSKWDGRMTPSSRAALTISDIRGCVADKIAADNQPVPGYLIRERILDWAIREKPARWLPKAFTDYAALLKACDAEIVAGYATKYGNDPSNWVWGNVTRSRFPHPLAVAPLIGFQFATPSVPLSGSGQTPNVASYVSMRHIASPGNWDATRHVIPLGESGNPQSQFYKDQFNAWKDGTPLLFPFSKEAISAAARETITLTPN